MSTKLIKTKDLKLVTSWTKTFANGSTLNGGAEMIPGVRNFKVTYNTHASGYYDTWEVVCPQGYGPGVGPNGTNSANFWPIEGGGKNMASLDTGTGTNYSWFGNYNLQGVRSCSLVHSEEN